MYTIHMDGVQLFNTAVVDDPAFVVLNPKFHPDTGGNGSLSFVLPPGNRMHGSIQKMKSIVTLEQDGEQLFRGRVLDVESDVYNQKTVYCESDRSFLLDSLHAPYTYDGTVHGLFQKLIANHNQQVDAEKQFTVGQITAVSSSETVKIENESYSSTSDEIESRLLGAYGGYLRTRTVGNTTNLDWVEQYGDVNAQPIEFGVNLLDLKNKADAGDVFTVLIPLGASEINDEGEYTDPLTVESVNNGKNYIQDDAAVALYGKIWRTHSWSHEDNPQKLLEKGREYLKTGAVLETLTLKAVDMHFVDGNVRPIRVGDLVRILSNPHGVDRTVMCTSIEVDLLNPENTVYTFGEKPRTLTENYVRTENEVGGLTGGRGGGGRKSVQEEIKDIIRWCDYIWDDANAHINFNAGEINKTNDRVSVVEIDLNGVEGQIGLKAQVKTQTDLLTLHSERLSTVEVDLNGEEGKIGLKAQVETQTELLTEHNSRLSTVEIDLNGEEGQIGLKAQVKTQGDEISAAELRLDAAEGSISTKVEKDGVISAINQTAEKITISASKIDLDGHTKISSMDAEIAQINAIFAGNANADNLYVNDTVGAQTGNFTNMWFGNYKCAWKKPTVVTDITKPILAGQRIYYQDSSGATQNLWVVTGWSTQMSYSTDELEYIGK